MKILIDNGHGIETKGKCSPDGKFKEYAFARKVAKEVVKRLQAKGYDATQLVPEAKDIPLSERAARANAWCTKLGTKNVCLVSIHVNAAGNGDKWHKATGWEAWTSPGQTAGDKLADCLYDKAEEILKPLMPGISVLIRTDLSDGDRDKEAKFTILTKTRCAAVLTENFFQDTKSDVAWLNSDCGFDAIVRIHVEGILHYINSL